MRLTKNIFLGFLFFTVLSCANDSESDLYNNPSSNLVTYNTVVKQIIQDRCQRCHTQPPQNGAPMPLTTYAFVKEAVIEKELIDRISRPQGATGMMPNGETRLPQYQINQIIAWRDAGFPE